MALEKKVVVDKIEIVSDFKMVQVRTATRFVEDGVVQSAKFHRHVVSPGDDTSNEDPQVQAICAAVHTQDVIDAYQRIWMHKQLRWVEEQSNDRF